MRLRVGCGTTSASGRTLLENQVYSPYQEQAHEDAASAVEVKRPPGLRIAAGEHAMQRRDDVDAERQDVQPSPPDVADVRTKPGADSNRYAKVECNNSERHPDRTV